MQSAKKQKVFFKNSQGEKLAGILHLHPINKQIIILCHGSRGRKESSLISRLANLLEKKYSLLRFDFSGNGESEGLFEKESYAKDVEDIHSVVQFLQAQKYTVIALVGHSKAATETILFANKYPHLIPFLFPITPRINLLTTQEMLAYQKLKYKKQVEMKSFYYFGNKENNFKVTKEQLQEMQELGDISSLAKTIKDTMIIFHGTNDTTIPIDESKRFCLKNKKIKLISVQGANHIFSIDKEIETVSKQIIILLTQKKSSL